MLPVYAKIGISNSIQDEKTTRHPMRERETKKKASIPRIQSVARSTGKTRKGYTHWSNGVARLTELGPEIYGDRVDKFKKRCLA